ncbi:MAG: protein kinase [Myxococcaceae bacterium]
MSDALLCPQCAKVLDAEPNFCPACGSDLRGLTPTAQTLSGHLTGTLIDGRYKVLEKLGEGGMGSVYKVEHVRMGKILALKVLRPDSALDKQLKSRFIQEARVVAKLSHPNTVQVFDSGELKDGGLFIAMEYLPGRDLSWHLRARGPMTEEKAVQVGIQVLSSLEEAHSLGIVHRDIKPANIMLVRRKGGEDQVKLLDFGIAKLQEAEGRKTITGTTEFIGTPAYMSPEQGKGEGLDPRSDLYSLGAVLFELITGRQVFIGPTPMSVVTQHMTTPPPRVHEVAPDRNCSTAFEAVLKQVLDKDPTKRFSNAETMRSALERVRREMGALPNDFTPLPDELAEKMANRADFDKFESSLRTSRALAPVATLLVIAALGLGGWRWAATHSTDDGLRASEVEPNDEPRQATAIALNTDVKGSIGATSPEGKNDRDFYLVRVPEGPVRITLSGVSDLNLTLEMAQLSGGTHLSPLLFLDDNGVSGEERVDALQVHDGPLYLKVEESAFFDESPRSPREKALVPYTLRVEAMGGGPFEHEPNDSLSTAQSCQLTKSFIAYTGARADFPDKASAMRPQFPLSTVDYFKVEVSDEVVQVGVLVVPPPKGKLLVVDGVALETWQQKHNAATSPVAHGAPLPHVTVVEGAPKVVRLSPAGGHRMVRIQGGEDCQPGAEYRVAFITNEDNGLASAMDLSQQLETAGRDEARVKAAEEAANTFPGSPQAMQLRSMVK